MVKYFLNIHVVALVVLNLGIFNGEINCCFDYLQKLSSPMRF